jgi:hypothetical protein
MERCFGYEIECCFGEGEMRAFHLVFNWADVGHCASRLLGGNFVTCSRCIQHFQQKIMGSCQAHAKLSAATYKARARPIQDFRQHILNL